MDEQEWFPKEHLKIIFRHFVATVAYVAAFAIIYGFFVWFLPEGEVITIICVTADEVAMILILVAFLIQTLLDLLRPILIKWKKMKNEELFSVIAA